jgi:hypothetical protein
MIVRLVRLVNNSPLSRTTSGVKAIRVPSPARQFWVKQIRLVDLLVRRLVEFESGRFDTFRRASVYESSLL